MNGTKEWKAAYETLKSRVYDVVMYAEEIASSNGVMMQITPEMYGDLDDALIHIKDIERKESLK